MGGGHIVHRIKRRKANWNGHILRRERLLKQVTEGRIEGREEATVRQGRRPKQLLDILREKRGCCKLNSYLNTSLKEKQK